MLKKMMYIFILLVFFCTTNQHETHAGTKYKMVTAYYCEPDPTQECLSFKGVGDIWLVMPGKLRVIRVKVPIPQLDLPEPPNGYDIYTTFFLFTNSPDTTTGKGIINGYLYYSDPDKEFNVYDVDGQIEIDNYLEWKQETGASQ